MVELLKSIMISVGRVIYFFLLSINVILLGFSIPWFYKDDFNGMFTEASKSLACFADWQTFALCCTWNVFIIILPVVISLIIWRKYPKLSFIIMMLPIALLVLGYHLIWTTAI